MEQQPPRDQFPQTVPPLLAPHEPSVVTGLVGEGFEGPVGRPKTGSWFAVEAEGAAGNRELT